ncbi:glycosyl transferase [Gemmobacter nanjingensis]|jgi:glycosyltransferase involved in cell wall biosynthesis|uniref:Glycosyl transferase n=1 Tax=Gemmobacter nanjingensis TaxID=488454 RepID=A0ABQ3FKS9_9RHOB|nr:glycosyltransferase family 2 protein [Gemmobacter nanjingensis]GHC27249.1 glycosyl transferase [Gemmobacter nanjingensis]
MSSKISCLVPAHDEAARIGAVLSVLVGHPQIDRVLVIDDGSRDGTAGVAQQAGAEVLRLVPNRGKTRALAQGIAASDGDWLLLIDADLTGLTAADITRLVWPVLEGRADVSLSLRGNAPRLWHWLGVDYISGERMLPRALIAPHLAALDSLPKFGFEVFLNRLMLKHGMRPAVVRWPGVASPAKAAKRGLWRGIASDVLMIVDILRATGPLTVLSQIASLTRQVR